MAVCHCKATSPGSSAARPPAASSFPNNDQKARFLRPGAFCRPSSPTACNAGRRSLLHGCAEGTHQGGKGHEQGKFTVKYAASASLSEAVSNAWGEIPAFMVEEGEEKANKNILRRELKDKSFGGRREHHGEVGREVTLRKCGKGRPHCKGNDTLKIHVLLLISEGEGERERGAPAMKGSRVVCLPHGPPRGILKYLPPGPSKVLKKLYL